MGKQTFEVKQMEAWCVYFFGEFVAKESLHWESSWPDHHSDCSTSEFLISTRSHQPSFSSPSGTQPGFFCVLIFRPYKWVLLSWEAEPGLTFSGFLEWAIGFSCSLAPIFYLGSSLELSAQLQQRALRTLCLWVLWTSRNHFPWNLSIYFMCLS